MHVSLLHIFIGRRFKNRKRSNKRTHESDMTDYETAFRLQTLHWHFYIRLHIIRTNNRWIYCHLFSSILLYCEELGPKQNMMTDHLTTVYSVHRIIFVHNFYYIYFTSDENAFGKQQTQRKEIFLLLRPTSYILTHVFLPLKWKEKRKTTKHHHHDVDHYCKHGITELGLCCYLYGVLVFQNALHFV